MTLPKKSQENIEVGVRMRLPHFQARSAGDDMSWKGSKTLRVAALQAGGVGTDPRFIGRWWGTSLSQLVSLGAESLLSKLRQALRRPAHLG